LAEIFKRVAGFVRMEKEEVEGTRGHSVRVGGLFPPRMAIAVDRTRDMRNPASLGHREAALSSICTPAVPPYLPPATRAAHFAPPVRIRATRDRHILGYEGPLAPQ
jgi:hypothetical protein